MTSEHITLNTVKHCHHHFIPESVTVLSSLFNHHFIPGVLCVQLCSSLLLHSRDLFSLPPTKPFPSQIGAPIALVKRLPWQPACSSAISGTRRRRDEVCSIMLMTCERYREGGREEVFRTSEPSSKSSRGERNRFLTTPTLDVSAASRQNTERLVVLSASRPKHWKKLLPVSSLETIKIYSFTMGQSTCYILPALQRKHFALAVKQKTETYLASYSPSVMRRHTIHLAYLLAVVVYWAFAPYYTCSRLDLIVIHHEALRISLAIFCIFV